MHVCQPFYIVQKAMQALIVSFIREMVCIVKVSMVLVNIVAVLLLMQHAAYLPTSKNLPHIIDLLAQLIYFFASNKQVSNEKYQLLCLDIAPG